MTIDVRGVIELADLHALVERDTELQPVGKELHGACPLCICTSNERRHRCDRFRLDVFRKRWYCRHCSTKGGNVIDYAIRRYGVGFHEACAIAVGNHLATPLARASSRTANRPTGPTLPSSTWQDRGRQLLADAIRSLWSPAGTPALEYLHARGLTGPTIEAWQLGYIPQDGKLLPAEWGLPPDRELYVPRGILIPWITSTGSLAGLKIRKPVATTERNKYASVTGSTFRLFGAPTVVADQPLILVEGEFDAIAAWQALGDWSATVALGSARVPDPAELRLLCAARPVLVALDADAKGDDVAEQVVALSPNCRRTRPSGGKDLSSCLQEGADLRRWFESALTTVRCD